MGIIEVGQIMKENDYSKRPDIDTYYNIEFLVEDRQKIKKILDFS